MDPSIDNMVTDDIVDESQDQQQTQSTQQSTQQASQPSPLLDAHLWGYLQPCNPALTRMDFWRISPRYTIGRNTANQVVLPGFKVSNNHCTITWDGSESRDSTVIVQDLSSNGTFINGVKIGKNQSRLLREGNEIAFGTCTPQINSLEDYRFFYRHTAAGPPTSGLYAHYDVSHELGTGSFATVMKAVSRATGEWYAVKMLRGSRNVNRSSRNTAFSREISIMEKLKHPNICELKEVFFEENHDINLVLEFVDGGDLLDYILRRNGLTEIEAQHITYQMCDALAYIHSQGVAHRDLKPENILLTKDKPPIVKVADFGLAKAVDSLTMLRTMCGTPNYLAPEVVLQTDNEGYDHVVDSWSVGVIVFSMLTNASPFVEEENQRDIRLRITQRYIDWNHLTNVGTSEQVEDFVRKLLKEDPLRRMTLKDALDHPWMKSYVPVYDYISGRNRRSREDDAMMRSSYDGDESGDEASNEMAIECSPVSGGAGSSKGSKTAPLQRRSHILAQAAEGKDLLEPSWEMLASISEQESDGSGLSSNSKGQNKRVHSELTPLSEEASLDAEMDGSSPLSDANFNKRQLGDDATSRDGAGNPGKGTRGKVSTPLMATTRTTRSRAAAKSAQTSEDECTPLRRSARHPQKVARKV